MNPSRPAAIASFSFGVGVLAQYLFVREAIGVNILVTVMALLAGAFVLRPRDAAIDARDAWLPIGALVSAALCAIRTDAPLVAYDLASAYVLTIGAVMMFGGYRIRDLEFPALVAATWAALTRTLPAGMSVLWVAAPLFRARALSRSSGAAPHAGGALLAVPFLILFGALFSSADAVFRHVLESIIDLAELRRLVAELPVRLVLASCVTLLTAGALTLLDARPRPAASWPRRLLASETAATMLLAIDALFASFVVIQFAYLFGGRDTIDAAAITYSAYGRSGFFELVAAASVVAALLFVLDLSMETRGRVYVFAALVLVALTGVVLASATLRMQLYQSAYGWSELRFYAFTGIAYIAVALGILGVAIARGSVGRALQHLALAGVVMAIAANVIGPSGFVARRNLERVIDPSALPADASHGLDVAYLISLGDGAVPTIVELLPSVSEPDRSAVTEALRVQALQRAPLPGWQSFVLDREYARSLAVRATTEGRFIR